MAESTQADLRAAKMAKAMSHPIRIQALTILNRSVASPSDIADELGLPVANVAYHIRALLQLGCIEEVEARPVRGALEHRYRAIQRAMLMPESWDRLPASAQRAFSAQWYSRVGADALEAFEAGTFDARRDRHTSFTHLRLDEQGWRKVTERLDAILEEAIDEQAAALERTDDNEDETVLSTLTIAHYERPPQHG